ncbi:thioredoxin-like protein [Hypoxylon sp. FL1284]|nr:thioredoxin-like protein [Hypoxylon sp. FL1284]
MAASRDPAESSVDLLVVGAGPAGLMLALWAGKFDMKTRIVDDKDKRVSTGHADGLQSRTIEIFQSFGIGRDLIGRAYHVNEICSWNPKRSNETEIERTQTVLSQPHHLSRFLQADLNQGATEQILLDEIRSQGRVNIERNTIPVALRLDEAEASSQESIFLAGDAVHTHSPTLGQGMNVSMQDAFNLGWKLGLVIIGATKPEVLRTYNDERRPVAKALLELDKEMAEFYSKGPSRRSRDYQNFREGFTGFVSGVAICYAPSSLISSTRKQGLARNIKLGQRLPSHKVICNSESNPTHISDMMPSNGSWKILTFAGDVGSPPQLERVQQLGAYLERLQKYHSFSMYDAIEIYLLHASTRDFDILDLHPVYHPWDEKLGWDYWKVFSDDIWDLEPCQSSYEKYGVDKERGCILVLRPDQHVSYIGALDAFDNLGQFFGGALIRKSDISELES